MERNEPTHSKDLIYQGPSSRTSPHIGDYGGRTKEPKGNNYDVFLSFKGSDTRKNFTDHLYHALVDAGIYVFWNFKELDVGEEIFQSLPQSKISIPIISENYASSRWCLRELAHMLKCKRNNEQIVLPIFYKMAPSEVRHLTGNFGETFHLDKMEVKEFKEALDEVSHLRGWETEKFAYGNEAALVKVVVTQVLSRLERTPKLIDTKDLIGIDDHVEHIMGLIDPKSNDTRIIGIYGRGGSGKTTLAKVLYKNLSNHFNHLGFVENIREMSMRMGIRYLQEQLIYELLRRFDVNRGIHTIRSQFANMRVLLVLDDVGDDIHLNDLIGNGTWFGAGSIIIITTRKVTILDKVNADPKYALNQLKQDQALTLFSRHLFGMDTPPKDYGSISGDVVSGMEKIPKALKVIGSSFRQIREEAWKPRFEKLKDDVCNNNVQALWRVKYETLDYEQQQIFLDIACFFVGSSKLNPSYMWESCGFLPEEGIEELRSEFSIEIDKDDKLIMREELRDFGRAIVRLDHQKELQQPSRLWNYEEALHVLDSNKGPNMIQAICLDKYDPERSFTGENFKGMTNLRFLKVCGANFTGDFENLLSELRWLQWECCPLNFVAANFHPKQLVVLNLSGSEISGDWRGWDSIKVATKLKVLNLSSCPFLRTPDLSAFKSLEILILEKCEKLEKIDPSIGDTKSLISLNVSGCRKLEELPSKVGRLKKLKELLINDTAIQEIPMWRDGLMKLETLNTSCCRRLKELPVGIGKMSELRKLVINDTAIREIPMLGSGLEKLETLSASGCRSLEKLPTRVGSMGKLRELLINDTAIQEIPISRGGLSKLETLCASYCEELAQLSESMGFLVSLTQLDLSHSGIEELPESMGILNSLTQLDLSYSWIEKLPKSLASLVSLTQLDLSHSGIREVPQSMSSLRSLTQLDLSNTGIKELPEFMNSLTALTHLNLSYLGIKELPKSLNSLVSLTQLDLSHSGIREFPESMSSLGSLTQLDLSHTEIEKLPESTNSLKELTHLNLSYLGIKELPKSLNSLVSLTQLDLSHSKIRQFPKSLSSLVSLTQLDLSHSRIEELPESMDSLKALTHLNLSYLRIEELPVSVGYLVPLQHLLLQGCCLLRQLPDSIRRLTSLTKLDLQSTRIKELPKSMNSLVSLTQLDLSHSEIRGFPESLSSLVSLTQLDLSHSRIEELPESMDSLRALNVLNLSYLGIKELPESVGYLSSLQHLLLQGCNLLRHLPDLIGRLTSLTKLDLRSTKIAELPHDMRNLKNLKILDIRGTNITRLLDQFSFALHDHEINWELM